MLVIHKAGSQGIGDVRHDYDSTLGDSLPGEASNRMLNSALFIP